MFVVIGWVLVIGSVIGSFMGVGGHLKALLQPFELLCIFGAAIGAFVVSNPIATLKKTLKVIPTAFKGGGYSKRNTCSSSRCSTSCFKKRARKA